MARYIAALLAGGTGEHGSILKPETLASMFAPHYQPDPQIPGMGLAFFRDQVGGHLVVEHEGLVPGFSSQLALGTPRVGFNRAPGVGTTAVHLESAPALVSFDKQPATRNPTRWATGALGAVAAASTATAIGRRHRRIELARPPQDDSHLHA
jgi:hypothetical protein